MAISKIIYKSSSSAQGETWMDLTQDTVSDASHIRNSYVGHLNDGTSAIGSYSGGSPSLQAKTNIAPTTSSQTITADAGYDGLSSVQINAMPSGTAGTPTATKGTVSNHSVSVTPSVTNTTGYITGSTKTGTAVTVNASELVSGSETKTANGTYDVTNLASLVVNVSGGASNVVTGTFKGTTTAAAMNIDLPYTGSGYPVAAIIYVKEGPYNPDFGTYYSLVQRYATSQLYLVKQIMGIAPAYSGIGTENKYNIVWSYKSSSSSATSYSNTGKQGSNGGLVASPSVASSQLPVTFQSATQMSVYIAGTSYGFAANIEYTYHIIYSS